MTILRHGRADPAIPKGRHRARLVEAAGQPGGDDGETETHMDSLARDEDILKAAEDWKAAGRGVALATVVETWGSAPRPVGSNLVIDDQGNFLGSRVGRLRRGRGGHRGARRDRERQAEDARVRRRRRDGVEGRLVVRRHDPRVRREGGLSAPRHPQSAQHRTRGAPRGRRRDQSGLRRAAPRHAGQGRGRSAEGRARSASALGQERRRGDRRGQGVPHRARAADAADRHRRGAHFAGARADRGAARL